MTDEIQNIFTLSCEEAMSILNSHLTKNAKESNSFISLISKITRDRKYSRSDLRSFCILIPSFVAIYQNSECEITMKQALEMITKELQDDGFQFDSINMTYGLIDKRNGNYLEATKDSIDEVGYITFNSLKYFAEENYLSIIREVVFKTTIKENKPYKKISK